MITQIGAALVGSGQMPRTVVTTFVPDVVTTKVLAVILRTTGAEVHWLAHARTTGCGSSSHGWCPCRTEACAAWYACQVVMSQMPGNAVDAVPDCEQMVEAQPRPEPDRNRGRSFS